MMAQSTSLSEKKGKDEEGQTCINPGCLCVCLGQRPPAILSNCTFSVRELCRLVAFRCCLHGILCCVSASVCIIFVLIGLYGAQSERRDEKDEMRGYYLNLNGL